MSRVSAFEEQSTRVAGAFLQSAVILDDQAYPEKEVIGAVEPVEAPAPFSADELRDERVSATAIAAATHGNNPLPTKDIVRAFAQAGMACAVLNPLEDHEPWKSLHPDVTILDWYVGDLTGDRSQQLLVDLITREQAAFPHQARLVLIYTTEQDLRRIREKILNLLADFGGEKPREFGRTGASWEGWHVIVLAKPSTGVADDLQDCEVDYTDLPDCVVREFSRAFGGLLTNVTLSGISAVRRNTYRLVRRFSPMLDAPYLTHRALLPDPSDAEQLLVSLIASECRAILEDEGVASCADAGEVSKWVDHADLEFPLRIAYGSVSLTLSEPEALQRLLEVGAEKHLHESSLSPTQRTKAARQIGELNLTSVLGKATDTDKQDALFALLTTQRPHYGGAEPTLSLGTIVKSKKGEQEKYWVCIQPRCDAVRVTKPRQFLFLELEATTSDRFCTLVMDKGGVVKLRRQRKPYEIAAFKFTSPSGKAVRAHKLDEDMVFSTSGGKKLTWLGQLRAEIAQQVAHDVSTRLSRVGVDSSEWLRLAERRLLKGS